MFHKLFSTVLLLGVSVVAPAQKPDLFPLPKGQLTFYFGTINKLLEVELILTRNENAAQGSYEYAGHRKPIRLEGELSAAKLHLTEYATEHGASGEFQLNDLGGPDHLDGTWRSADGKRQYEVHLSRLSEAQHKHLQQMWSSKPRIRSLYVDDSSACVLSNIGAWCWGAVHFMPGLANAGPGMVAARALPNLLVDEHTDMLATGGGRTCALRGGAMSCWQRSSRPEWFLTTPTVIKGFESGVSAIGIAGAFTCGIVRGELKCWDSRDTNATDFVTAGTALTGLSSGSARCATSDAGLQCWTMRFGKNNQPGIEPIDTLRYAGTVDHVVASSSEDYDALVCWIVRGALKCKAGNVGPVSKQIAALEQQFREDVTDVALASDHACVVQHGAVYCWGKNNYGQLGNGTSERPWAESPPAKVDLPASPRQLAIAEGISCVLTSTDEVYCWGDDQFGQTGAISRDLCERPNGHADAIETPCNKKPVRVRGFP